MFNEEETNKGEALFTPNIFNAPFKLLFRNPWFRSSMSAFGRRAIS
jgi:hypothetical protein